MDWAKKKRKSKKETWLGLKPLISDNIIQTSSDGNIITILGIRKLYFNLTPLSSSLGPYQGQS